MIYKLYQQMVIKKSKIKINNYLLIFNEFNKTMKN